MGSFTHEAVAADPATRTLFLTEDDPAGRLYRFTPAQWGQLETGTLEVARTGDSGAVTWIPAGRSGATTYAGGEGIAYYDGSVVFTTKSDGRIRAYDTRTAQMRVLYEPSQAPEIVGPDNITFALNGDLYVCEDTPADQDLLLFGADGARTQVLRLDASHAGSELAGVAFDPSGTRMYISSQRGGGGNGVTYEVSGPFRTLAGDRVDDDGRAVVHDAADQRRSARGRPDDTGGAKGDGDVRVAGRRCGRRRSRARARRPGVAAHPPGYDNRVTLFPGPSLDELRDAVDTCTACDLYKEATQAVFGAGPRDAALMLMGEVPGDKEDLAGQPFVGPAGKVLDEALAEVGIDRAQIVPHERGEALQVRAAGQGADPQEAQRGGDPRVQPVVAGRARARYNPRSWASWARPRATPSSGRASGSRSNGASGCRRPDGTATLATIHPSAVLRAPPERRDEEYAGLVHDLRLIAARVA